MKSLSILYYHEIVANGKGYSFQMTEIDKFEQQMKYLSENGYKTILFSQLNQPIDRKTVLVSFDDGYLSVYENAVPILKKYGIKGNVYLPTGLIGSKANYMNWDMINSLYKSGCFDFATHSHSHCDITKLSFTQLLTEFEECDRIFLKNLGFKSNLFCIPYGHYNRETVKNIWKTKKYEYVTTSYYGQIGKKVPKNRLLPRIPVSNDDSMDVFISKLKGKYNLTGYKQRLKNFIRNGK